MALLFSNNAASTLLSGITDVATTLTVQAGDGPLFPSPSPPDSFRATLEDASNNIEIIDVTNRSSDVFTMTRGLEGTVPLAFLSGDAVELRVTKNSLEAFLQSNSILVVDKAAGYTIAESDKAICINVTSLAVIDLLDSATALSGFWVIVKNSHTANITVGRDNAADTIDGVAGDITIAPNQSSVFVLNSTPNGYLQLTTGDFFAIATTSLTVSGMAALSKGADIASAGDTILLSDGNYNDITGDGAVISGATQANPCVITANTHGFSTGYYITINDVVGMVELNGNTYLITILDANTFQLDGINSTGFTLYDSGGSANPSINGMTDGILNEVRKFKFDGQIALKHNVAASNGFSSLFLPQSVDYVTEANDELEFTYDATLWRLTGSSFYSAVAIANGLPGAPSILGLDFLTEIVISNDAIAAFTTDIDSTYDEYIFTFIDVVPVTDGVRFEARFSTDGGSAYITTNTYTSAGVNNNAIRLTGTAGTQLVGSASGEGISGRASLYNPASTTQRKRFPMGVMFTKEDGAQRRASEGQENTGLAAINAIKFFFSSGNLESGTIRMYGRRIQ